MLFTVLGVVSALVFVAGDVPYIVDTIRKKTKPHRVTWGVFALLNAIGFANQYASGAHNSLWLFGAAVVVTGIIFILSLWHGSGGETTADILCLMIALVGVVIWVLLKSPTYSIFANGIADIAAMLPTYQKARHHPETETRISWLVAFLSVLLATISVGAFNWRLLLLPGLSVIMQGYMVYLLYFSHTPQIQDTAKTLPTAK